ncbi:MAG TPA: hypothetical protein VME17_12065 [Bryobacteraceae bacterium]|nr:hypothetical protein [Bryobacteraceae bacterium]
MAEEDISVTTVDELSQVAHAHDRTRKLSEYSPTNMPLSASEIEQDEARDTKHCGWAPRTTENIGDLAPLPEHTAAA